MLKIKVKFVSISIVHISFYTPCANFAPRCIMVHVNMQGYARFAQEYFNSMLV